LRKGKRNGSLVLTRWINDRRAANSHINHRSKHRSMRARKISWARLIVAKLKINATHARFLNMLCDADEFFRSNRREFLCRLRVATAEHNRGNAECDDAGNEDATSLHHICQSIVWSCAARLRHYRRLTRFHPTQPTVNWAFTVARYRSNFVGSSFSNSRIFPSLYRSSIEGEPHVVAEP